MQAPVDNGDYENEAPTVRTAAKSLATVLLVTLLLSVDELNPVKVLCSYTRDTFLLSEGHVGFSATLLLLALAIHQRDHLLYFTARTFFRCTFNNMFFRSVEIIGMENLPKEGPIILTGNHNNQFVDGLILLTNCHREISFMIAQKSWDRPLVGFLARAFHCIPVARPQDTALTGDGVVLTDGTDLVRGIGSHFDQQLTPGAILEVKGFEKGFKVKEVISSTELRLETPAEPSSSSDGHKYKVLPKVDQSAMYNAVYSGLKQGKCLGIFPEGGSHDRTYLLPLKAGVAVIALEAFSKHHLNVPIVPVGLNYFHGHRFGGRVVVEFGSPVVIEEALHAQHETDKRGATEALLQLVTSAMRSVLVPTQNFNTLQQIYMVRRLWVRDGMKLSAEKAMDLNRRFAVGTSRILQLVERSTSDATSDSLPNGIKSPNSSEGNPTILTEEELKTFQDMRADLVAYMANLKKLRIRDHQVPQIGWWTVGDLIGRSLYLLVTLALGAIPNLMFNLPVIAIASRYAAIEREKSLKSSNVKLTARDVVMSYKVIYVLVCIPCLYMFYGFLLFRYASWRTTSKVLALLILPFFAFLGMKASEQGVKAYKDLVPLFRRTLVPAVKTEQDNLPQQRAALQRKLHLLVRSFGPKLGDLYFQKEVDWSKEMNAIVSWTGESPTEKHLRKRNVPESSSGGSS